MAADHFRIFRPTWGPGVSATRKYAWYFLDQRRRRVNCRSGYEALFATHPVATGLQFEYESLALVVTGKALFIPNFFLSTKGEFVELKGWTGNKTANQERAITLLKKKGFAIHVLDWNGLRKAIKSPYLHCKSYFDAAASAKASVEDFVARGSWLP